MAMMIAFGMLGYLLTVVSLTGLFSVQAPLPLVYAQLALGLAAMGMAFSRQSTRSHAAWPLTVGVAALALVNLLSGGPLAFTLGSLVLASGFLCIALHLSLPTLHPLLGRHLHWVRVYAPVR